jgi:hypothetical protein
MPDERRRIRAKNFLYAASVSCFTLSALCFVLYYEFYMRPDFNEDGRFFDEASGVVTTANNFAWIIPAAIFLIAGTAALIRARRSGKK